MRATSSDHWLFCLDFPQKTTGLHQESLCYIRLPQVSRLLCNFKSGGTVTCHDFNRVSANIGQPSEKTLPPAFNGPRRQGWNQEAIPPYKLSPMHLHSITSSISLLPIPLHPNHIPFPSFPIFRSYYIHSFLPSAGQVLHINPPPPPPPQSSCAPKSYPSAS